MATTREKILVGMSGGVDSAVAALLLLRAGYEVEGLHMTNWEDDDGYCSASADYHDARRVCAELGIPLHRVNFTREYRDQVFAHFLNEYRAGRTPNPDVLCNREIKFGVCLDHARRLGADRLATGHYARIDAGPTPRLLRGLDPGKDQSYFLHAVDSQALRFAEFPLGGLHKAEVRELANDAGLPVHAKRDSTGICFIGERPFREFLSRYLKGRHGAMETPDGEVVGEHRGLMFYTPGQRQGLGIGGRAGGDAGAWYVAGQDPRRNVLIVVQGREHPLLWKAALSAEQPIWIHGEPEQLSRGGELEISAQIRYRQRAAACRVRQDDRGRLQVRFEQSQWAVAPGQYVVFYDGDECLGGATIQASLPHPRSEERLARSA
jgi:tRNA-specific 2-thiouridylase